MLEQIYLSDSNTKGLGLESDFFFICVYLTNLCTYANDGYKGICTNNQFSDLMEIYNSEMWTLTEKSYPNLNWYKWHRYRYIQIYHIENR